MNSQNPKIKIKIDKGFDQDMCLEFLPGGNLDLYFHELKNKNKLEAKKIIIEKYNTTYKEDLSLFQKRKNELEKNLDKIENVMKKLSEIFHTSWEGIKEITIIPCLCPIFPRFIKLNTFFTPYKLPIDLAIKISAHETTHFIYFKKLKEIYPEIKESEFDYPHSTWIVSELLAPIIINDPKIQEILNYPDEIYSVWQDIKIGNKDIYSYFEDLYKKSEGIEEFIKSSMEEFNKLGISEKMIELMN